MSDIKPVHQTKDSFCSEWVEVDEERYNRRMEATENYEGRILYPAAAYESLQKENAELKEAAKYAEHIDATPANQRETMLYDTLKERDTLKAESAAQAKRIAELEKPPKQKMAPVQGYVQGIPWDMHLEAYNAYCKRYGAQQALIEGDCRGGFGVGELDMFIPGWREKLSLVGKLNAEIESLRKQVEEIKELCAKEAEHWQKIGKNPDHACGQYIAAAIRGIKPASKNGE